MKAGLLPGFRLPSFRAAKAMVKKRTKSSSNIRIAMKDGEEIYLFDYPYKSAVIGINQCLMKFILGLKLGMTQIFDEKGNQIPMTLIEAGPCQTTQIKKNEGEAMAVKCDVTKNKKAS